MLGAERRAHILAELDAHGTVKVSNLVVSLGVSDMTIRRDLTILEETGLLEKVHGGAIGVNQLAALEPGFEAKSTRRLAEKEAIAAYAATLVRPGWAIAVSAGTTTHTFARHLVDIPDLTVVTNSVQVADLLHRRGNDSMTVLLSGGLRTPSDALVGPLAIAALQSLHLDAVFMGIHGMDPVAGFSSPNLLEAETNRTMIKKARRLCILSDSSKWGMVGLSAMAELGDATEVITDTDMPASAREVFAEMDVSLTLVDAGRMPDEEWTSNRL